MCAHVHTHRQEYTHTHAYTYFNIHTHTPKGASQSCMRTGRMNKYVLHMYAHVHVDIYTCITQIHTRMCVCMCIRIAHSSRRANTGKLRLSCAFIISARQPSHVTLFNRPWMSDVARLKVLSMAAPRAKPSPLNELYTYQVCIYICVYINVDIHMRIFKPTPICNRDAALISTNWRNVLYLSLLLTRLIMCCAPVSAAKMGRGGGVIQWARTRVWQGLFIQNKRVVGPPGTCDKD